MKRSFPIARAAALLAVLWYVSNCQAGIVVSIDKATVQAGQTVLLGVYASSESGDIISGFNLPFDYNSDGFVDAQNDGLGDLPVGFTFAPNPISNILYSNTGLDQPNPQVQLINTDSIATGTGGDVVLGNSLNPTKLFDLVISVDASVPVGTVVPFQIKVPTAPFTSLFNIAGPSSPPVTLPNPGVPATGSITIIAVPEPRSFALVLSASMLTFSIFFARRRAYARSVTSNRSANR